MGGIRHLGLESDKDDDKYETKKQYTSEGYKEYTGYAGSSPRYNEEDDEYWKNFGLPPRKKKAKKTYVFQNGKEVGGTEEEETITLVVIVKNKEIGPVADINTDEWNEDLAWELASDIALAKLQKLFKPGVEKDYKITTSVQDDYDETQVTVILAKK